MSGSFRADLLKVVRYLERKTASIRGENCCDDYGFTCDAALVVFRYSRMRTGDNLFAFTAISAWLTASDMGFNQADESLLAEWGARSRCGEVVRAIADASKGEFDLYPDDWVAPLKNTSGQS